MIDYIGGENRRIYLRQGVTEFHPVDDVYKEMRTLRKNDEDLRRWDLFMEAVGNEPKGGGKSTPRYAKLLDGCKIVPYDESGTITVLGELLNDTPDTDPEVFDLSTLSNAVIIKYAPTNAEIIYITSGSGLSTDEHDMLFELKKHIINTQSLIQVPKK